MVAHDRTPWICDLRQQTTQHSDELEQELRGVPRVAAFDQLRVLARMESLKRSYTVPPDEIVTDGIGLLFAFPEWAWACPTYKPFVGYHVGDVDRVPDHWPAAINDVCDVVLTPSKWCASVLKNAGVERRIHVVRHGIDPEVFKPGETPPRREPIPKLRFFCSSESGTRKGLPELVTAWKILQQRKPGCAQLAVRGAGPLVRRAFAGLPHVTIEVGEPMRPPTMAQVLRETDLLLVPSRAEGFGLCLAAGTLVTTRDGVKPIESIVVGEKVLTHLGRWRHVLAVSSRHQERVHRVACRGVPDLLITKEHVVLAASRAHREYFRHFAPRVQAQWMPVERLDTSCYLALRAPVCAAETDQPVKLRFVDFTADPVIVEGKCSSRYSNGAGAGMTAKAAAKALEVGLHTFRRAVQTYASSKAKTEPTARKYETIRAGAERLGYFSQRTWLPCETDITPEICHLLGYYATEGSVIRNRKVPSATEFSFDARERDDLCGRQVLKALDSLGLRASTSCAVGTRGRELFCSSSVLARTLVELCGSGAYNKRLPAFVWDLSSACRVALLEALVRGDGNNAWREVRFSSVSRVLAFQVRDLWMTLGIPCAIRAKRMYAHTKGSLKPLWVGARRKRSKRLIWDVSVTGSYRHPARALIGWPTPDKDQPGRNGSRFVPWRDTWVSAVRNIDETTRVRTKTGHGRVYDLQVEEDESFVANGVVVHNCPLQSIAVGTPVITTDVTGHAEWAHTIPGGISLIETGDMKPCPPGPGLAPELDAGHLADVIENAVRDLETLKAEAAKASEAVRKKWSWEKVLTGSMLDKLTAGS
jgi:glycosyltransferase involved in cell wall biosynthesis